MMGYTVMRITQSSAAAFQARLACPCTEASPAWVQSSRTFAASHEQLFTIIPSIRIQTRNALKSLFRPYFHPTHPASDIFNPQKMRQQLYI
ncbi:MAG: hypothetical protein ACOX5R_14560 [bacterium]